MEFLNVMVGGKKPYTCREEENFLIVVPLEAVSHIRFDFLPKKGSKKEDWENIAGAKIITHCGRAYELPLGTARRLYAKVENTMLKI